MVKSISDLTDDQLRKMHSDLHKGYEWCMNTGKQWNEMESEQVDALHTIAEKTMRRRGLSENSTVHDSMHILNKGVLIHRVKAKEKAKSALKK